MSWAVDLISISGRNRMYYVRLPGICCKWDTTLNGHFWWINLYNVCIICIINLYYILSILYYKSVNLNIVILCGGLSWRAAQYGLQGSHDVPSNVGVLVKPYTHSMNTMTYDQMNVADSRSMVEGRPKHNPRHTIYYQPGTGTNSGYLLLWKDTT